MKVLGFNLYKTQDLAISLEIPGGLRCVADKYIIEGIDDTWIDIVKRATVFYIGHNSGYESDSLEEALRYEMCYTRTKIKETISREQTLIDFINQKLES